jgi:hypothetical protein
MPTSERLAQITNWVEKLPIHEALEHNTLSPDAKKEILLKEFNLLINLSYEEDAIDMMLAEKYAAGNKEYSFKTERKPFKEYRCYFLDTDYFDTVSANVIKHWGAEIVLPKEALKFIEAAEDLGQVCTLNVFCNLLNEDVINITNHYIFITNKYPLN